MLFFSTITNEDEDITIAVSSFDYDLANYGESHTFTLECGEESLVQTSCNSTGDNTADCTFDVQLNQNSEDGIDCGGPCPTCGK